YGRYGKMNRIKQLRKEKKLSIVEVAENMGVQKLNVLKWEHGTSQISIREAKKLAEYFGVSIGYLLGFDDVSVNNGINELIAKINEWAISHGLDKGNPKIEWMKVTEEVGEIRDVFLKPNDFDDPEMSLKDAIGDSIVTLVVLCLQLGYDVEECLKIAYNNIKDRQGVMIDDNFVKSKTRYPVKGFNISTTNFTSNQHSNGN
ncbi:helix-turn-helix domain-containing protein, partial [Streptococcus thermophilus]